MNLRLRILLCCFFLWSSIAANDFEIDFTRIDFTPEKIMMILNNTKSDPEIKSAAVLVEALDQRVLNFKLKDAEAERWEVPIYNPDSRKYFNPVKIREMEFIFSAPPFGFKLYDRRSGKTFLSTMEEANTALYFSDKLIEFGLQFEAEQIFGLGERVTPSFELCEKENITKCIYTTYNKDALTPLDEGGFPGGKNAYGHHPFYLLRLTGGYFAAALFLNSNAQDTIIEKSKGKIKVTHKTIGGIIDLYVFYPGPADEVIKKYHAFIGRPYVPPFWTLGFHQSRWGWKNLAKLREVMTSFEQNDLPLDVLWSDIDYMQDFKDFTVDNVNYKGLKEFVDDLHKRGMYWVPIIDAGLAYDEEDKYYRKGKEMNAFIKSAATKDILIGKVWPGKAVYPAWMNVNASALWHMGLTDLFKQVEFDGVWIDMNEASNFCDGECLDETDEDTIQYSCDKDPHDPHEFDDLPYFPGGKNLSEKAISPTGYHFVDAPDGSIPDKFYKEYNLHSLWAFHQANSTNRFFTEVKKKRPFVLTRASFVGTGRFSSKWLGDNHSTWEDLKYSIIGMYNFQLFGIPLIGADMCGFIGNTTVELCARWMQLGAFYPFSRNHNVNDAISQEPYFDKLVATATRSAIRQKYSILRYYYTKLFEVSLHGGTLVKPLFFDFPKDDQTYEYRNETFMIGSAVMVVPVLRPKVKEVTTYLPNQNWFNLFTGEPLFTYKKDQITGKTIDLYAGYEYVNVLIKGGSIIPFQDAMNARIRKVKTLDYMALEVIIAPDEEGKASGNIIFDDEDDIDPITNKAYTEIKLSFVKKEKILKVETVGSFKKDLEAEKFFRLTIFGAEDMADIKRICIKGRDGKIISASGFYYFETKKLTFFKRSGILWSDIVSITFGNTCGE